MEEFTIQRCCLVAEGRREYASTVTQPENIRDICVDMGLHNAAEEHVSLFTFNTRGKIIGYHEISHGSITGSVINPTEVFKRVLLENASGFALVHNHPSMDVSPSQDDIVVTKRIAVARKIMGVAFLDHIIISPDGSCESFRRSQSDLFETTINL